MLLAKYGACACFWLNVRQELARIQREHAVEKRAWDRERRGLVSQLV